MVTGVIQSTFLRAVNGLWENSKEYLEIIVMQGGELDKIFSGVLLGFIMSSMNFAL
jgi:hypothetical protein